MAQKVTEEILHLFKVNGSSMYGGEAITQLEHALQAAYWAKNSGASHELITASLLHDIGHLLHDLPDDASDNGIDDVHEELASTYLTQYFKESVVQPAKLHVQAKRYLCAKEEGYFDALSAPSKTSLSFQGGIMSENEIIIFEQNNYYQDAIALRKWDDLAKDPNLVCPGIESYVESIQISLK